MSHETRAFSFSVHSLSRLLQGPCTWFLHHPHISLSLSLSGHPSLLLSSLSPTYALLQGTHVKALFHCLEGLSSPVHTLRHVWSSVKVRHVNSKQYGYGWECKMVQWLWKVFDSYLNFPCNLATSLLGIYPREMKAYVYTKTYPRIFMQVLFIIASKWS